MKKKFNVTGMTCSACSSHVEKATLSVIGVKKAEVNLLSATLTAEYDEKTTDENHITEAIKKAGYGATEAKFGQKDKDFDKEINGMKRRLLLSVALVIPLMYVSMGHMLSLPLPHFENGEFYYSLIQLLLCLPVLIINRSYFINGFSSLFKRSPNMNTLISIGSSASFIYGIFAITRIAYGISVNDVGIVHLYSNRLYFESAAMILALIDLGKYFEAISKGKTSEAIKKLTSLAPKFASVERDGDTVEIPVEELVIGDVVNIKSGDSVPCDGLIIYGTTGIDESAVTGESIPVMKIEGDEVIAGTVNKNGFIRVRVTKTGEDTALAKIIALVEQATSGKAPISELADKVAAVFVPAVMCISFVTFAIWILTGAEFSFALSCGISVLVISCPCALGLATPVAVMVGMGKGAEYGILFKSGQALQRLSTVDCITLDKTGTVTEGKAEVQYVLPLCDTDENTLLSLIGSLEKKSGHPLAQAVENYVNKRNITVYDADSVVTEAGRGISGTINGVQYFAGNRRMMNGLGIACPDDEKATEGMTLLYFSSGEKLLGIIGVADRIKKTSAHAVAKMRRLGIDVVILTGDNRQVAKKVSESVGANSAIAELLPADKADYIVKRRAEGKKVAMIGDGINDSPALATADVGIAIGAGTDVAVESADVVLMKSDLLDAVTGIRLSKKVMTNIKENLFWAFFYNVICIPVAAGALYPLFEIQLSPMIAAAAMSFSSLFVVLNSLRIKRFKTDKYNSITGGNEMFKIRIEGMMCKHCQMRVENALNAIEGVNAKVDLKKGIANVECDNKTDKETLVKAVTDAGYKVVSVNE